ncbi:MAG: DMT family transporter [Anaerolineae bacterium]
MSKVQTSASTQLTGTRPPFGLPDVMILLAVLIWGVNTSIVKATLAVLHPMVFNALRFSLSSIVMVLISHFQRQPLSLPQEDLRRTFPIMVIGVLLYQLLFVFGLSQTTAGNTSVILATIPIFIALYWGLIRRQRLPALIWAGAVMTFIGVALLTLGSGKAFHSGSAPLIGDGLILLAAVCWAAYTIGSQSLLERHSPTTITTLSMLFAAPVLDLIAVPQLLRMEWGAVPWPAWAGLLFSAVFSIALSYLFWNTGVQYMGSARATAYSNLTPIIALITAWIALRERLNLIQMSGAAVVLVGIWLVRFDPRLRRRPRAPAVSASSE